MLKEIFNNLWKCIKAILIISIIPYEYFYEKEQRLIVELILKERGIL